jgi:hypothetical protein
MIKVLLDTNTVQDNWLASGEAFTLLGELVARGKCEVFMSEVSILEHVRHYQKKAPQMEQELKTKLSSYAKLFVGQASIKSPPVLCDVTTFEKRFRDRLKELGVTTITIPQISHGGLVKRDLAERKPFAQSGKGYRDALIWLGFVDVIDQATTKAVVVTSNHNDFSGDDKETLHPDLRADLETKSSKLQDQRFAAPKKLADELIKPLLIELAEEDKTAKREQQKSQRILKRLREDTYKYFTLDDVVAEGLEYFESQGAEGTFYAGGVPLEEPLWVTMVESPMEIDATSVYKLKSGNYLCEGTADVIANVQGYLDKFEAFNQSENGTAFVTTPDHNEWYSEVEVSNQQARITFSFEFEEKSSDISKFEVIKIASNN